MALSADWMRPSRCLSLEPSLALGKTHVTLA
jgi:hypothetical protein